MTRLTLPQRRKEETRARILESAASVFARRGYDAATVEEITAECGIAKGGLYGHFASKEELFRTVLVDHVERRIAETVARVDPDLSLRESIVAIVEVSWSTCRNDPIWSPLFMEAWALAGRNEWGREAVATLFDHCSAVLGRFLADAKRAGLVRADLDVDRAARLLLAVNDGLVLQWQAQPNRLDPEEFLAPMTDVIVGYVTGAGETASGSRQRRTEQDLNVAEIVHPEALASTAWLADHLGDPSVRVVDARFDFWLTSAGTMEVVPGREAYDEGHIPGAVFVDVMSDLVDPENPLVILSRPRFEALMGRLGISDGITVVVYDDRGGTWAASALVGASLLRPRRGEAPRRWTHPLGGRRPCHRAPSTRALAGDLPGSGFARSYGSAPTRCPRQSGMPTSASSTHCPRSSSPDKPACTRLIGPDTSRPHTTCPRPRTSIQSPSCYCRPASWRSSGNESEWNRAGG